MTTSATASLFVKFLCLCHAVFLTAEPSANPRKTDARNPPPSLANHGSTPSSLQLSLDTVAARDEDARIEGTIRHLLAQREVELDIIVVDDRSADRTSEILQRLAKEDARVQMKRVDVLPDRWLGKCHACHVGANAATGDWILFTDADCWLKPDVIARGLRVAERDEADHITLVSGLATGSVGLKASHLMFLISLANWFSGVNRDRPKSFMGIGAFNLYVPFMFPLFLYTLLNSAFKTLRQGGIRWRDTFYPLEVLRSGNVR